MVLYQHEYDTSDRGIVVTPIEAEKRDFKFWISVHDIDSFFLGDRMPYIRPNELNQLHEVPVSTIEHKYFMVSESENTNLFAELILKQEQENKAGLEAWLAHANATIADVKKTIQLMRDYPL